MELLYIQKLNMIFFIGLLAVSWCCVFWIGNRKRQFATFIVVFSVMRSKLIQQFPHEVDAKAEHDMIGEFLALSVRPLPYEQFIPQIYLYAFSAIFILWFIYDICWQKFKLKHSVQQIFASWRVHQPFFPIKKS